MANLISLYHYTLTERQCVIICPAPQDWGGPDWMNLLYWRWPYSRSSSSLCICCVWFRLLDIFMHFASDNLNLQLLTLFLRMFLMCIFKNVVVWILWVWMRSQEVRPGEPEYPERDGCMDHFTSCWLPMTDPLAFCLKLGFNNSSVTEM